MPLLHPGPVGSGHGLGCGQRRHVPRPRRFGPCDTPLTHLSELRAFPGERGTEPCAELLDVLARVDAGSELGAGGLCEPVTNCAEQVFRRGDVLADALGQGVVVVPAGQVVPAVGELGVDVLSSGQRSGLSGAQEASYQASGAVPPHAGDPADREPGSYELGRVLDGVGELVGGLGERQGDRFGEVRLSLLQLVVAVSHGLLRPACWGTGRARGRCRPRPAPGS
ncbi:hypothetical protein [Streptomyces sp900116325]|uniref:hypothetical protein n=1 Tax=Streptomyces sp. 900116325 TaxID=3154295 RepID=UPI0033CE5EE0